MANARVFERAHTGKRLRKQAGLHLLGDFKLLCGTSFGFQAFGHSAALLFDRVRDFVETDKRKRVAVGIPKTAEDSAPNRRRMIAGSTSIVSKRRLQLQ